MSGAKGKRAEKPPKLQLDPARVAAAKIIVTGPSAVLTKVPRAGATTSMAAALDELGIPALIVAPYNKIQESTIPQATDSFLPVLAHKNCERVKKKLKEDPFLEKLLITIPDCFECKEMGECPVFAPRVDSAMITSMTYAKLMRLMLVETEESREIKERLKERVKVIIFDESHLIGRGSDATIEYGDHLVIPGEYGYLGYLFHSRFEKIVTEDDKEHVRALERDTEVLGVKGYYAFKIKIDHPLTTEQARIPIGELQKLTKHRKELDVSEETILKLLNVISIMSSSEAVIHLIRDEKAGVMKTFITGQTNSLQLAIKNFVQNELLGVKVFFVSGTQSEPWEGFYKDMAGCYLAQVVFPDLDNSNAQMTVYPDSWKISWKNNLSEIDRVCDEIRVISEKEYNQRIYLVTINQLYCDILKEKLGKALPNVFFDYYRSENTTGVANDARVCIAVCPAETPTNACDHLSTDYEDSQRIRLLNVHADTWQAWSRVKDPFGKVPSKVYCIGIRAKSGNGNTHT